MPNQLEAARFANGSAVALGYGGETYPGFVVSSVYDVANAVYLYAVALKPDYRVAHFIEESILTKRAAWIGEYFDFDQSQRVDDSATYLRLR